MWDDRFAIRLNASPCEQQGPLWLMPLGRQGLRQIAALRPQVRHHPVPKPARPALPALVDQAGIFSVPHLGFRREVRPEICPESDSRSNTRQDLDFASIEFRPANPLAGAGCFLAYAGGHIM
jgi:hypothetical protein